MHRVLFGLMGLFIFSACVFAVETEDIIVSGVMHDQNSDASRAIVNGGIVKAGDKIGDAEIIAIKPSGIVVKKDGQEQEIGLNSPPSLPASKKNSGQTAKKDTKAKSKSGFLTDIMEKIKSLVSPKSGSSPKVEGPQYYLKAKSFYQQAQSCHDLKERVDLYQSAIKQAQYSLEIDVPDSGKSEELRGIIEDSRAALAKFSEQLKRKEEMERLFAEGRRFEEIADNASYGEAWTNSKKKENYNLALQYYNQAYGMADGSGDKQRIGNKVSEVEAHIRGLE